MKTPAAEQWKKVGIKHHHGVNVPVFSLKTKESSGIGEYLDLIPLIEWCSSLKLDLIQLLPLSDTNLDNSPFSPISSFCLNPLLISLSQLPYISREDESMKATRKQLQDLNSNPAVDWKQVRELKMKWMRAYHTLVNTESDLQKEFEQFKNDHKYWLGDYALFCSLKRANDWKSWKEWSLQQPATEAESFAEIEALKKKHSDDVDFFSFMQFLAFKQMGQVRQFAESKNVLLKGDIPFLVSMDSADVWRHRKLFNMNLTAGAPPDMYAADGQNWGLPLYNWKAMEEENCEWWRKRLEVASNLYHVYRVDHIVGFFRVWGVPVGKKAIEGSFQPSDESLWITEGEKHLRMLLESSMMLPIGEDLGSIPPEVRICLQRLGICGTKVLRWERLWDEEGQPFIPTADFNRDSMTTVSTHDSETLDLWWTEKKEEAEAYAIAKGWTFDPAKLMTEYRQEILKESHTTPSLFHVNLLNEYLALDEDLVHQDAQLERINVPGTLVDTNWAYRMRPTLEEVRSHPKLEEAMKNLRSHPDV
eukprot:TRINITY_DN4485_c0_g1_i1.p1 TRINITY_DN4485_c0_g1~~TRINITY_DN4485_c0_g1_i1.p1  ORF type:complete len:610 (+),score=195.40 TRINITY_DN4485_c0_g1_i1:237-1832(+)